MLRDADIYALPYCVCVQCSHRARHSAVREQSPSPRMCRCTFQTPFFLWACCFHPGAPEDPGIGFSIIMEVTAWCLLT